ncbi:MAG: hypothetical protein KGH58_04430, partial [Candidatus Micrarchaeota archaeon]|nr:hypothetical protein [Candidatus Micrarchaeota archaeon]
SAARYERAIEESIDDYYKSVADAVNDVYAKHGKKISGIVVGGPGPTKENFVRSKNLNYQIKVVGTFDTGYVDEHMGVHELLEKAKSVLSEQASIKERTAMERFMNEMARGNLAVAGYDKVRAAMNADNISRLIVSEEVELTEVTYRCTADGETFTAIEQGNTRQTKHSCGSNLEILEQRDPVEALIEKAEAKGIEMVFISVNSQYGSQLLMGFQGIAAMLRYKK